MNLIKKLISFPYQCAHEFHKFLYALKILKSQKLPKFSIVVGNLSFGGTGKTPFTIRLAEELINKGFKPCVLIRGYKSQKNHQPLILDTLKDSDPDIKSTGDEALEIFEHFKHKSHPLIMAIHPSRLKSSREALLAYPDIDIFILDDGYQHLAVKPDLRILLKNINETGFSREFAFNETNADFIIYTKVNPSWLKANPEKFAIEFNLSLTKTLHNISEIGIFTGIGDPRSLQSMILNYLEPDLAIQDKIKAKSFFYPDHHFFSRNEVTQVLTLGINVITTRKDLTKIPCDLRGKFNVAQIELKTYPANLFEDLTKVVVKTDVSGLVVDLTSPIKGELKDA
ncbi:MAG: hypothetical protein RLZZ361_631 [Cyanobacteriota bacterium]|jgi:tetraacyldisaccharide 4'-kinase